MAEISTDPNHRPILKQYYFLIIHNSQPKIIFLQFLYQANEKQAYISKIKQLF